MIELFEWVGCATGLSGAALLACNKHYSGWGFALFLASNVAWIFFGVLSHTTGIVVMQMGFTVTSIIGVWRWLIAPNTIKHIDCR